jgi:hypothetical protein
MDNQPLGRLLDLIDESPNDADERVIVVLNTAAASAAWNGTWFEPSQVPSWLTTLLHVVHARASQSHYDDLRRVEKTNRQIAWIKQVAAQLDRSLDDAAKPAVLAASTKLHAQRDQIRTTIREASNAEPLSAARPPGAGLEELLLEAAGLAGKLEVMVEVISPQSDDAADLTGQRLSSDSSSISVASSTRRAARATSRSATATPAFGSAGGWRVG